MSKARTGIMAVSVILIIMPATSSADDARSRETTAPVSATAGSWLAWHTDHVFDECDDNCGVAVYGGPQITTHMATVFDSRPLPWTWKSGSSGIVGGTFSRRLATLWGVIDVEPEIGVAKRFGDLHQDEVWGALYFRWTKFPWNDYLRTTLAVSTGLNYATVTGNHSTPLLHYFSPEVTFALPSYPHEELLVRFHHRSSIWIFKQRDPGWQYMTVGIRHRF